MSNEVLLEACCEIPASFWPETLTVRFRTVRGWAAPAALVSDAATIDEVAAEIAATNVTERGKTRADDRVTEAAMEDRKRVGLLLSATDQNPWLPRPYGAVTAAG